MSTLLSQISHPPFETVNVTSGNDDGSLGGSNHGATFLEASERSLGLVANYDGVARGDNQCFLGNDHLSREGAEENARVTHEQTEKQRINADESNNDVDAQGDNRSTLVNPYPEKEKVAEQNMGVDQDEIAMKKAVNSDEQANEGQGVPHDKVSNMTSKHPSSNISTPTLAKLATQEQSV
ncbi:hypothetical protein FRC00_004766 [Tulasnella sp. 408]|nr:hypothetical protein FRC00_004766 [Tulasnella sp. 408]